jgi:hypothetical protein
LWILAGAAVVILVVRFGLPADTGPEVVAPADSIELAEKRLARLRRQVAALPAREQDLQAITVELARREKGMIQAETAAQAQAQLLQILRRLASAQSPAIELRTAEMGQARALGDQYAEISVPVAFECRIEQLLNLLADLAAQPEALATSEMRIAAADAKEKTMNVRLTVSGVCPRRLLPEKKGPASF